MAIYNIMYEYDYKPPNSINSNAEPAMFEYQHMRFADSLKRSLYSILSILFLKLYTKVYTDKRNAAESNHTGKTWAVGFAFA